jgi:hypothetical protein
MFLPCSTTIRSILMNLTLTIEITAWVSDETLFFEGEYDSSDYTVLPKSLNSKLKPRGIILHQYY